MITIQELLYNRGLDRNARAKLVRHKDRKRDIYNMYRDNREDFLAYQEHQVRDVFKNVDYLVSFVGEEGLEARFVGVYKITGCRKTETDYYYTTEEVSGFEDLKEKVIIKWENAISWHQWIKNEMEVLDICPGLNYKSFTDYLDFSLSYNELKDIVSCQHKEWKKALSSVKGVYLITDKKSGKLYVGSAYGEEGIWGRWVEYIKTEGHGGNTLLQGLINLDSDYMYNFQYSILMILPKTVTAEQAIEKERMFKNKLGTKSYGLNKN